jgi:hypothetical protein
MISNSLCHEIFQLSVLSWYMHMSALYEEKRKGKSSCVVECETAL